MQLAPLLLDEPHSTPGSVKIGPCPIGMAQRARHAAYMTNWAPMDRSGGVTADEGRQAPDAIAAEAAEVTG